MKQFRSIFIALLFAMSMTAKAQPTYIGPSIPDTYWYSSMLGCYAAYPYIDEINTAAIDYLTTPCAVADYGSLIVSSYTGNGSWGGVVFSTLGGFNVQWDFRCPPPPYPPKFDSMRLADIIVGNDLANPTTDYRVAVAFTRQGYFPPGGPNGYMIDYFLVHFTGSFPVFTVSFLGSTSLLVSPSCSPDEGRIHLDVIAEKDNTTATCLPWCDQFVVTWSACGAIYACSGSLNAMALSPATLVDPSGKEPDVAAIQRDCSTCPPGTVHSMGLISYLTTSGTQVKYAEYNATIPGVSGFISSGFVTPNHYSKPRIDAIDDHNINKPTIPPTNCFYKAVAELDDPMGVRLGSHTFDNMTMPGHNDDGTIYGAPTYEVVSPTVAYGGNSGAQYQVCHHIWSPAPPFTEIEMEPIDWMLPTTPNIPALPPVGSPLRYYFGVNTAAAPGFGTATNAISTPCNEPDRYTLVSWSTYTGTMSNIYYKATPYAAPNGYAFKPGKPETPAALAGQPRVYPNPANTQLTVEPAGAQQFRITDVLGGTVRGGVLQAAMEQLDINTLVPGAYSISLLKDGRNIYNTTFVKQ